MTNIDHAEDLEDLYQNADPSVRIGIILTREGRVWSEQAMLDLTGTLNEAHPDKNPDSGVLWLSGGQFNAPSLLAHILSGHPETIVVLSMNDRSVILNAEPEHEAATDMAKYLELYQGRGTSWSILTGLYQTKDQA